MNWLSPWKSIATVKYKMPENIRKPLDLLLTIRNPGQPKDFNIMCGLERSSFSCIHRYVRQ